MIQIEVDDQDVTGVRVPARAACSRLRPPRRRLSDARLSTFRRDCNYVVSNSNRLNIASSSDVRTSDTMKYCLLEELIIF
ncbi:hypothetical protein SFRURICE_008880 [Spodoptera frugiperda]|nr:hypothetical protein SFRURICE_008880 [Spodoptera frugiperda]